MLLASLNVIFLVYPRFLFSVAPFNVRGIAHSNVIRMEILSNSMIIKEHNKEGVNAADERPTKINVGLLPHPNKLKHLRQGAAAKAVNNC